MLSSSNWDTATTSSIVLTRLQGTAAVGDAMDRLLRALEHADLDSRRNSKLNGGDEAEMLIAERIPLQTWNKFAQLEELPRSLRLRQLVWDDDKVWVVEYPLSPPHEIAVVYIGQCFPREVCGTGAADITIPGPNGQLIICQPDASCCPCPNVPGVQAPQGIDFDDWRTVIVEVLNTQTWPLVHRKIQAYRQRIGVQYILCVKMAEQLNSWSYEFYDVGDAPIPAFPHMADRHAFRLGTVGAQAHEVVLVSRRVLGLPAHAPLPAAWPDNLTIDIVDLARYVHTNGRMRI